MLVISVQRKYFDVRVAYQANLRKTAVDWDASEIVKF